MTRGFKIGAKKEAVILGLSDFSWQPRFHDRVIRSEKEMNAARRYIKSNPQTWDKETIPWQNDGVHWAL